jgi:hypothetical protein
METIKRDGNVIKLHDDYGSFVSKMKELYPSNMHFHDADFAGAASFDDAYGLATGGWHDRKGDVDALAGMLMHRLERLTGVMLVPDWDIVGGSFDYPSYSAGDPECMVTFVESRQRQTGRIFRLLIDPGGTSRRSPQFMMNRAAAIVTLLDIIQRSGNSLELWIASPVTNVVPSGYHTPLFCLHPAGGVVDVDSIMFACGHPSFLRWIIFTQRKADSRRVNNPFGRTVPVRTCDQVLDIVQPDYIVERSENAFHSEPCAGQEPERWIIHTLEQLGVLDKEQEMM